MDEARFEIRHATQDTEIFNDVVVNNQYRLPDGIAKDALVIDIGANIGAFAVACLLRGAGQVICFEPSPENFKQLCNNLASWPGQTASWQVGVWRSDVAEEIAFSNGTGTATGCCFPNANYIPGHTAPRANSIGLDEIIRTFTADGERRVDILKIDAEFSEYPILYTCKMLHFVDKLLVEAHAFTDRLLGSNYYGDPVYKNTVADLEKFLRTQGFDVSTAPESFDNQINTLLFCTRTPEKA
jgi:FkbM family methyltransferase